MSRILLFAASIVLTVACARADWPDWRGRNRDAQFDGLPKTLPIRPKVFWRADMTGPAMAGISATETFVVVADKSADANDDLWHCFDAVEGRRVWTITKTAAGRMEYTNAPRATPVIVDDQVYFQSAFGRLICVQLQSGKIDWEKHLIQDFGGELPTWGYSVPPLIVGNQLIAAPGGIESSLISLDRMTGNVQWKTEGHAAAYAPFLFGSFGNRDQIVGYDSASLGGWDLKTGKRLWELVPPDNSDFNVPTPVKIGDQILLATENNGTRIYDFAKDGTIIPNPVADYFDCGPDTCTPVITSAKNQTRVFCSAYGELFCLDAEKGLEAVWHEADERFYDHTCLIAGNDRLLLWGSECDLLLIDTSAEKMKIVSELRPMKGEHPESMSHPALVGDRIYLRSGTELICMSLTQSAE